MGAQDQQIIDRYGLHLIRDIGQAGVSKCPIKIQQRKAPSVVAATFEHVLLPILLRLSSFGYIFFVASLS
jgi:hypothetical protein